VSEQERRILVLGRYTYTIQHKDGACYVRCDDTTDHQHTTHGPMTVDEAHNMLDAREKREEDRKR